MNKKMGVGIGVLAGVALVALAGLWNSPESLVAILTEPFQFLWESPSQFATGVMEVSENIEPVEEATRRLLKPLGVVSLTRRYPPPPAPDSTAPPHRSKKPN